MGGSVRWTRIITIFLGCIVVSVAVSSRQPLPGVSAAADVPSSNFGQTLSPAGITSLHAILDSAHNADLRWPDFPPYKDEIGRFYETGRFSLAWVQNGKPRPQA